MSNTTNEKNADNPYSKGNIKALSGFFEQCEQIPNKNADRVAMKDFVQ